MPTLAVSPAINAAQETNTHVNEGPCSGLFKDLGEPSDDRLMRSYCKGNQQAFDKLYARYKQPLYSYLLRNCRVEHIAGELYQDVWLRVISSAKNYTNKGKFRSWVFTLAHNRLVDYYRRAEHQYLKDPETESLKGPSEPEQVIMSRETMNFLEGVIQTLPFDQQQAFYLREENGFCVKEIADIQGITAEAAKSRLRYAYAKLRTAILASDFPVINEKGGEKS
jgi:RNA polymerase sigma factor (sigma-70 family)